MTETHNDARMQKPYPQPQFSPCSPTTNPQYFFGLSPSFLLSEISLLFTAVISSLCVSFLHTNMFCEHFISWVRVSYQPSIHHVPDNDLEFWSFCLYISSAGIIGMHIFHAWFYAVLETESRVFYKMSYIPYAQLFKNLLYWSVIHEKHMASKYGSY